MNNALPKWAADAQSLSPIFRNWSATAESDTFITKRCAMDDPRVIETIISGIFSFLVASLASVFASWVYWRQAKADLDKLYKSRFNE